MKLADQLREALQAFAVCAQEPALIGGLAVVAHGVVRATSDLDFLVATPDADALHAALIRIGYECIYRTENVANYVRDGERLDVLYAHRPHAIALLRDAQPRSLPVGALRVVGLEGLIGFKLQALHNNPSRAQDREDIRELLRVNRHNVDKDALTGYFALFAKEDWLRQLLQEFDIDE